ncbi:hypothetical protein BASA81_007088 [Batrachochytrium salamandrivorans]|nr:hypothetical protein BASA81_007088 [Batrachochytrium salamandrivorans]
MDSNDQRVVPVDSDLDLDIAHSRRAGTSQAPRRAQQEDFDQTLLQQPRHDFASLLEMETYLRANPKLLCHPDDVEHLVMQEFPHSASVPTSKDIDQSMVGEYKQGDGKRLPFGVGDYAERLGDDMQWHLEPIRRLVVFKDQPNEVYYKFESGVVENSTKVRCSEEAVCRHFGMRPHLWQQYALLRFESKLRFQQDHENDFEEVDYLRFAQRSWDKWLAHPKNVEFLALYESKPEHVREKLKTFVFSPFALCRQILKDNTKWNFAEAECSAYQYASFLGSGFVTCLHARHGANPKHVVGRVLPQLEGVRCRHDELCHLCRILDSGEFSYCNHPPHTNPNTQVVPAVAEAVYSTLGESPSLRSRLNSLRLLSWQQGDDTISQKVGFKMDRYMNSVYIALTNLVMMFALFLTNNTVDIILNALAVEFITSFDEEVANTLWFDANKRFLRASVIECEIAAVVLLEHMNNPKSFCKVYDCREEDYHLNVNGPLCDPTQAAFDDLLPEFMDVKEKIWFSSAIVAKNTNRKSALWQFEEQTTTFGVIDYLIHLVKPGYFPGLFNRYQHYYTWTKWDSALFLPRVPEVGEYAFQPRQESNKIINFDVGSMSHPYVRFVWAVVNALAFVNLAQITQTVYRQSQYFLLPFIVLDSLLEWVFFVFLFTVFPAGLCFYTFLVVGCQPIMYNTGDEGSLLYNTDYNFGG